MSDPSTPDGGRPDRGLTDDHVPGQPQRCNCDDCIGRRCRRLRRVARSSGNRLLSRLCAVLERAQALCDDFNESHGGRGCRCALCRYRRRTGELQTLHQDLHGLRWAAEMGQMLLGSIVVKPHDDDGRDDDDPAGAPDAPVLCGSA